MNSDKAQGKDPDLTT